MNPVDAATQTQLRNIEKKTGRSFSDLSDLVRASGLARHGEIVAMLKRDLGLGHGDANTLAHLARGSDGASMAAATEAAGGDPADGWYAGKKASLRPIHDKVLALVATLGDAEHAPKKTYVSLRRRKQFLTVGPATATQVEIGFNLPRPDAGAEVGETRLQLLPPGGMCSHRVRVSSPDEVDGEVEAWIRRAFDAAG